MNCEMLAIIEAVPNPSSALEAVLESILASVPQWFETWEQTLSRFRPDSELSRLNTAVKGQFHPMSDTLCAVLAAALDAAEDSDGIVSPTVLDWLENAGYRTSFEPIVVTTTLLPLTLVPAAPVAPAPSAWREIALDRVAREVSLPPNTRIDLGGVAKGWAADQAADRLCAHGAVLVDAGGDISVRQPCRVEAAADTPHSFVIGIANPHEPSNDLEWLSISEGGVATSGRDYRCWWRNDKPMHHLIDPRTGLPAQTDILSATVIAPSAQQADIAAKIWLILGSVAGTDWLESQPDLAGLAVLEDGTMVRSSRLERHVWSPSQLIET